MVVRLAVLGVMLVMGALASPVVFGQLAKGEFQDFVRGFKDGAGDKVQLDVLSYQRGYLDSVAITRLTTKDRFEARFIVEHRITHGPLDRDGTAILMRMSSEVWPEDPTERSQLEAPVVTLKLDAPFLGPFTRAEVHSPEIHSPDGSLQWSGLTGFIEVSRATKSGHAELETGGLKLREKDGSGVSFLPISARADFDFTDSVNPLRDIFVRAERLGIRRPGKTEDWMGPIEFENTGTSQGDLVGHTLRFEVEAFRLGNETYGPMALELEARNIEPEALTRLRALRDQQDPATGPDLEAMTEAVRDMAPHSPTVQISRLELHGPEGDLSMKGSIRLDGDVYVGLGEGGPLRRALFADTELEVTETFLLRALDSGPGKAARAILPIEPSKLIEALIENDYMTRKDGMVRTRVQHKGGPVMMNERRFQPATLLTALSPAPAPSAKPPGGSAYPLPGQATPRRRATPSGKLRTVPPASSAPGGTDKELDEMRRQMGLPSSR